MSRKAIAILTIMWTVFLWGTNFVSASTLIEDTKTNQVIESTHPMPATDKLEKTENTNKMSKFHQKDGIEKRSFNKHLNLNYKKNTKAKISSKNTQTDKHKHREIKKELKSLQKAVLIEKTATQEQINRYHELREQIKALRLKKVSENKVERWDTESKEKSEQENSATAVSE